MKESFSNLNQFLEKFKNIIPRDTRVKEIVQKVFEEEFKRKLEKEDISVRKKDIVIRCSPVMKQEITLRQERLLEKIHEQASDLRFEQIG